MTRLAGLRILPRIMRQRKRPLRLNRSNIVGVVDSQEGLQILQRMPEGLLDVVELRLDLLGHVPANDGLRALSVPLLATVRHPDEGGAKGIGNADRLALYEGAMDVVQAVDVELASVRAMSRVIEGARRAGRKVVLSVHDFEQVPPAARVRRLLRRAVDAGADVFKIAATPGKPSDIGVLLELLDAPPIPVAVMGMGPFGKVSRLLLARCGSVLNYGWIDRPAVEGQWSAPELRVRFDELGVR